GRCDRRRSLGCSLGRAVLRNAIRGLAYIYGARFNAVHFERHCYRMRPSVVEDITAAKLVGVEFHPRDASSFRDLQQPGLVFQDRRGVPVPTDPEMPSIVI